jgi:hypothetical protein
MNVEGSGALSEEQICGEYKHAVIMNKIFRAK